MIKVIKGFVLLISLFAIISIVLYLLGLAGSFFVKTHNTPEIFLLGIGIFVAIGLITNLTTVCYGIGDSL